MRRGNDDYHGVLLVIKCLRLLCRIKATAATTPISRSRLKSRRKMTTLRASPHSHLLSSQCVKQLFSKYGRAARKRYALSDAASLTLQCTTYVTPARDASTLLFPITFIAAAAMMRVMTLAIYFVISLADERY